MCAIAGTYPPSLRAGIHPAEFSHGLLDLRTKDVKERSVMRPCAKGACRPPIEMSPLSPFQMSLSWPGGCWERVTDDGDCDEPHGDRPDARAQGYGGWPDYGERGRAADVADAPPGVPAGQGLP